MEEDEETRTMGKTTPIVCVYREKKIQIMAQENFLLIIKPFLFPFPFLGLIFQSEENRFFDA